VYRLSPTNENGLTSGIKRVVDGDCRVESLRSQLVLRTDFNL